MAIRNFEDKSPQLGTDVYVDEAATVIGDVHLHDGSSVWPGAIIRADDARVDIGKGSAMMDLSFAEAPEGSPVMISDRCLISHGARLHGCVVLDECLIGIGAIVLDKAHIGANSVIAAGAIVVPGTKIPSGSLVMGTPARVVRQTGPMDREYLARELERISDKARKYMSGKK